MSGHRGDLTSPLMTHGSPPQVHGDVRGAYSPPRSPALAPGGSIAVPQTEEQTWFIDDQPSRQFTGSTVASESDFSLASAYNSPHLMMRNKRLQEIREKRGWKYFWQHQMQLPLAAAAGVLIGVVSTLLVSWLLTPPSPTLDHSGPAPYELASPPTEVPLAYMMAPALNNSCLIPELALPTGKPQTFDACSFVIKSTDEVWNLRGNVDAAIEKYFHEEYFDAGSWGHRIVGKKALREAVLSEMRAFPDIRIHITDCVCRGNDVDGYKCAMPDVLTGTNTGPSGYGPPTGKWARWTGLVESLVKFDPKSQRWQYYAEWGVHDEWALIQQLGLDFTRVPHPYRNSEPIHDCSPLLRFGPSPTMDADDVADQQAAARAAALSKRFV